jgi:CelD/BcsL family acetyltransferase involved in cellulose biosynthesis
MSRSALDRSSVVRCVEPRTDRRWEAYVADHPGALVYHHPAWLEVIERVYGYKLLALACETDDGRFRGVLPLFRTRGLLTGRRLSSLPHTPVAGPLGSDDAATAALVRSAMDYARAAGGATLQIKVGEPRLEGLVDGLARVPWESTYVLELPAEAEQLRFRNSRNRHRVKWAIDKAAKSGVRVREAETEDELRAWYRLYLGTMREHVVPPRPYRFFRAVWDVLGRRGMMRLLLAEQHDGGGTRLLAGSIFLRYGSTVCYAYTGSSSSGLRLHANDAIQWAALRDACRTGFRRYDFGEVANDDPGLAEFKRKWGAEPTPLLRYYVPAPSRAERRLLDSGPARRIAAAAWRQLPLQATMLLGDPLYRYF